MDIRSIVHKSLRLLYEADVSKGLDASTVDKLRKMMTFLESMQSPEELRGLPTWKAHTLTGNRRGTWALQVTRNWRLTFRIENDEIVALNLEDYH